MTDGGGGENLCSGRELLFVVHLARSLSRVHRDFGLVENGLRQRELVAVTPRRLQLADKEVRAGFFRC